jgi:hypothetical protein
MKKFQDQAKLVGMTVAEVAVLGGGMIVTKKFLDFNVLFKNQIEKDPKFAEKWFIKHQGAIKLVAGAIGAYYVKNPWVRMLLIGVALEGFVSEVRVLTTNKDGVSFFDKIGQGQSDLDAQLLQAAKEAEISGGQLDPASAYPTAVGQQESVTDRFPTAVGSMGESYALTNIMPGDTAVGQAPLMAAYPMF